METARPTWRSRVWLVAAALVMMLIATLGLIGFDRPTSAWVALAVAGTAAGFVVAWAISRTRRERRHYEEELAAWAEERARHAERLRIAADLHDLVSHGLGVITVRAAVARTLAGPEGDVSVPVTGPLHVDDDEALSQAVLGGLGISLLPTFIIGKDIQHGRLQAVLSEYITVDRHIYAMYLPTRHLPSKVRVFIDFLLEHIGTEPYWDQPTGLAVPE